jgi:hypothetical protein
MALSTNAFFSTLPQLRMATKKLPKEHSGKPNLGGKTLKLLAKDDAQNVYCIPAYKVANGEVIMPFRHPEFAASYYTGRNEEYHKRFKLISYFAKFRNHRIMKKINKVIETHEGKKLFKFTPEMSEDDECFDKFYTEAISLGVNPQYYMDENADTDDVEQSTNSWCLNQNPTRGKASDNIVIITDLDGIDWFILIERKNGPGRSQAAWAGGFVDKDETFTEAALREKDEETSIDISNSDETVQLKTTLTELPVIISNDWDPRAKFVEGMEVGALVTHHVFARV